MRSQTLHEVFDTSRFLYDVKQWIDTQHIADISSLVAVDGLRRMSVADLGRRIGVKPNDIRSVFRTHLLSLWMTCRLADICGLSLDRYRINSLHTKELAT